MACLLGMMGRMELVRLVAVVHGVEVMRMRDVGMVPGFLVVAVGVRLGGGVMVLDGVFVMCCGLPVVVDLLLLGHVISWVEG